MNEPDGAFYVFPMSLLFWQNISKNKLYEIQQILHYLLEKAHVATVTGDAFGDPTA